MKIFVIGTRGIPHVLGGVESHCEELYPRLQKKKLSITVLARGSYFIQNKRIPIYKGVSIKYIYAPRIKSLEAILHTFLCLFYSLFHRPDILHFHAIGPSLFIPLAKLFGFKTIMTHHGQDYIRQKWGMIAKMVLKWGEWLGVRFCDELIVISVPIKKLVAKKFQRHDCHLIYNGVNFPKKSKQTNFLKSIGVSKQKYIFTLGRFVEEKGFHDLIDAFEKLEQSKYQLVIAGDADHKTLYSTELKKKANKNIIFPGFIKGEKLCQLFSHCALFALPSYHEGLSIALLEAMSFASNIIASNISANLAVELSRDRYFKAGNVKKLGEKLQKYLKRKMTKKEKKEYFDRIKTIYNWDVSSEKVYCVYKKTHHP